MRDSPPARERWGFLPLGYSKVPGGGALLGGAMPGFLGTSEVGTSLPIPGRSGLF